jgi:hypothetical protein
MYGADKPRLLNLKQTVYMGGILGCIETVLAMRLKPQDLAAERLTVCIRPGGAPAAQLGPAFVAQEVCEQSPQGGIALARMPVAWVEPMMTWINTTFETDLGLLGQGRLASSLDAENRILTGMKLKVDGPTLRLFDEMMAQLPKFIEVRDASVAT